MIELSGQPLTLAEIESVAVDLVPVSLSPKARDAMQRSRKVVEDIIAQGKVAYGVNTGFGRLSDVAIPHDKLGELQLNLVRSHACGFGEPMSVAQSRALTLLRANVLAKGFSGARPECADILIEMLNKQVTAYVPLRGSVGASGDLAPLAHLALVAIGEGSAKVGAGAWVGGNDALSQVGLAPLQLEAKDGLSLLNGTQAIGAVGNLALSKAHRVFGAMLVATATSIEALMGTPVAFDERVHIIRQHQGQVQIAAILRDLLADSQIRESHKENDPRVQDAYSLRCTPQVYGPVLAALRSTEEVLCNESGAATDNPLVFADEAELISGGNFHGAPLALALDQLAIAIVMAMSITERRMDRLVNADASDGLPPFLAPNAGLESGYMIAHVAAVAALNEARVLAHPACIDNSPTSAGKEDHVSMGMTSAIKFDKIVELFAQVVACELVMACQGLEFRKPLLPAKQVQTAYNRVRNIVPPTETDRAFGHDIEMVRQALLNGDLYFNDLIAEFGV